MVREGCCKSILLIFVTKIEFETCTLRRLKENILVATWLSGERRGQKKIRRWIAHELEIEDYEYRGIKGLCIGMRHAFYLCVISWSLLECALVICNRQVAALSYPDKSDINSLTA